jgi:hypothetical protein
MTTIDNDYLAKTSKKYYCENCHYYTDRKHNMNIHVHTEKHKNNVLTTKTTPKIAKLAKTVKTYDCNNCCKIFNDRAGLWRHKQKCNGLICHDNLDCSKESDSVEKDICDKELILTLLKQNAELLEIVKNGTISCNNNTNIINSNNKTFNLQVFLNETCKDAMNISEFIESVKLQVSDLENVGKVGYIEGISNIIIKNLQALEVEKRPVHCTDQKREVMYVKEDNIWEKEDESNKRLRKLVRAIAHKNICMLKAFRDKYPDCEQYDSKKGSQYNKLVIEAMGGKGDNDYEKNTKIIKKIAKAVGIDKN